jgi:alkylation response protein AidB-like acyl-CoA dehydrogenase
MSNRVTADDVRLAVERLLQASPSPPDAADPREFWTAQFHAGLAFVANPVGAGGLGAGAELQSLVDDILAAAGAPLHNRALNPIGIGMAVPTIIGHGTESMRDRYLLPTFTTETLWCQLFSEPGAGSDLASLRTAAVRDGDYWVVNGQKVWTSLAHAARYGLLLARTDAQVQKHRGLTYFVIDMHAPGVEVRPLRQLTGDAEFNEVFLTDVRIADTERLGEPGEGWRVALTTLMNERTALADEYGPLSVADTGNLLARWADRRSDPCHRDDVVRLWIRATALRLTRQRARRSIRAGGPGPEGSILKLAGVELQKQIEELALDVRGAKGLLCDGYDVVRSEQVGAGTSSDPARRYLRSRANSIEGGTSEIMRNILGERVLGLPAEPR